MIILRQREFSKISDYAYDILIKNHKKHTSSSGNEDLSRKVIGEFENGPYNNMVSKIRVREDYEPAFQSGMPKRIQNRIRKGKIIIKDGKLLKADPEWLKDSDFVKGHIKVNNLNDTSTLAHELGHAERQSKGASTI